MNKILSTPLAGRQQGYSVVELLIASVVGLIVLSGAVTVFTGNKSSQQLSSGMARIQESGRVALDILSNDIRLAGFQGCTDGSIAPKVIATQHPTINLPDGALWGSEYNGTSWSPAKIPEVSTIDALPKPGTDIIYVQHGSGRTTILATSMTGTGSPISLAVNPDQLSADDLIIISDCSTADIFRATKVNAPDSTTGAVSLEFGAGTANTSSTLSKEYAVSAGDRVSDAMRIMRFESNAYFIADSGRTNSQGDTIYSLFVLDTTAPTIGTGVELVEGVEDMQVVYGERLQNGSIRYLPASNANLNLDNVVSVQIGLLLTSTDPVANKDDGKTYMLANEKIGPPDGSETLKHSGGRLIRSAFNATIQLRNR